MSPRAAWRLERHGFADVYDYELGKTDWLAFDLPYQGEATLAGDVAVRDLPTGAAAEPDASVGEVLIEGPTTVRPSEDLDMLRHRMEHGDVPAVLVTRPDGVLVGAVLAS